MIFFKPFILRLGISPVRCGELWLNCKLSNQKSIFKINTRSFQTKRQVIETKNCVERVQPKNIGISFENRGNEKLKLSMLWKPFFFTVSFSAGTFAVCAIWQYENRRARSVFNNHNFWDYGIFKPKKCFSWREKLNEEWNKLTDSQKLFYAILSANIIIYLGWKIPQLSSVMLNYFTTNPANSALCWPLVLSTFSHYNGTHFFVNMFALNSFICTGVNSLGIEQFTGLYLAGGAISSFVSLCHRVLRKRADFSIGASGAIMAVIGYIAAKCPELELSLIFLPMYPFTAQSALMGLVAIDLMGLLLRWRIIDHASHLGGVGCGLLWYNWGNAHIWQKREPLLNWWHELRARIK